MKLIFSCFLFLLCTFKTYSQSYSDSYTLPPEIRSSWLHGLVFKKGKAHKIINVNITEFGKINDDVGRISKISGIPRSKFSSELYFTLPGDSVKYSLPVNDSTFDYDSFRPYYEQLVNGIAQEVILELGIYRRKYAGGGSSDVWIIERVVNSESQYQHKSF